MKTKVMEMSITSETVSWNIVSGEMEVPIRENEIIQIAKKVPRVPNKDKEQNNDQGNNQEREIEIEQTSKDINRVIEAYFNFTPTQKKKMVRMKQTIKKRFVQEDHKTVKTPKVPKEVRGK